LKHYLLVATVLVQTSHKLGNQNIFLNTIAAAVRELFFGNERGAAAADYQPRWASLLHENELSSFVNLISIYFHFQ
jgi:hypothetical protein